MVEGAVMPEVATTREVDGIIDDRAPVIRVIIRVVVVRVIIRVIVITIAVRRAIIRAYADSDREPAGTPMNEAVMMMAPVTRSGSAWDGHQETDARKKR